jgi:hypothetical protein
MKTEDRSTRMTTMKIRQCFFMVHCVSKGYNSRSVTIRNTDPKRQGALFA